MKEKLLNVSLVSLISAVILLTVSAYYLSESVKSPKEIAEEEYLLEQRLTDSIFNRVAIDHIDYNTVYDYVMSISKANYAAAILIAESACNNTEDFSSDSYKEFNNLFNTKNHFGEYIYYNSWVECVREIYNTYVEHTIYNRDSSTLREVFEVNGLL